MSTDRDPFEASATSETGLDRAALSRAVNELQASEARVRRNAEQVYDEARSKLVHEPLPVIDNLERALKVAAGHEVTALVEGVTMVRSQLEGVLRRYGVERIDAQDKVFDPTAHQAVSTKQVADASRVGVVVEQLEPGYRFGNKLLRPARVVVGIRKVDE